MVYVDGTVLCRSKEWYTMKLKGVKSCSITMIVSTVDGFPSLVEGEEVE